MGISVEGMAEERDLEDEVSQLDKHDQPGHVTPHHVKSQNKTKQNKTR
jgi:hypothetical protein